ncbi:GumC family protein [Terriglobus albidus]|uniref:GumC family protein n=1 Tax=Terriglobus albidus TaxID=1592106 RepID=UPI0021E04352|nr:Wzz/FepE/Etk N-terminal domain-containing protein [Terriglobus albidus]
MNSAEPETVTHTSANPEEASNPRRRWIVVSDSNPSPRPRTSPSKHTLRSLLLHLLQQKRQILLSGLICGALTAVISLFVHNTYTATASLLPPQQNQPALTALVGRLGDVASLAGARDLLRNPGALYTALLRSRSIADAIVDHFQLQQVYRSKLRSLAISELENHTVIDLAKEGVITITVKDHDPKRAAAIANAYIEELSKLCDRMAISGASQRRVFFEKQAAKAGNNLADSEHDLQLLQENKHLLAPEQQVRVLIAGEAELRSRIATKQIEIQHLLNFRTPDNPDVLQAQHDLAALQAQLSVAQATGGTGIKDLPGAGLAFYRKQREVKYYEALLEALMRQVEAARLDEANEAVVLQTVDQAVVPDRKSGPMRKQWALTGILFGIILGIAYLTLRFFTKSAGGLRGTWKNFVMNSVVPSEDRT